jgi:PPOX class probable F420-dependent enzyme
MVASSVNRDAKRSQSLVSRYRKYLALRTLMASTAASRSVSSMARVCQGGRVRLGEDDCWARLAGAPHGVLATVHPDRGVDAVPVVFAITDDRRIVIPIDTVKPKSGGRLQRLRNLEHDPRCLLLVDHYEDDWSRLWWVRVHARGHEVDDPSLRQPLLERHAPYTEAGTIAGLILLDPTGVTGWQATPSNPPSSTG